ncbi:MAG TPA: hypothetical protein VG228_08295 [Solirubrobacteraceae bacterium]|jgi:ABC-type nitrate/sulfonate/bicarbonate transport system permease component|nr:hypothetical protein [Solirubrobacteraceae bacterium]
MATTAYNLPLVQMIRMLSLFGLVPAFIVWFGIGQLPKVILVALAGGAPSVSESLRRRPLDRWAPI